MYKANELATMEWAQLTRAMSVNAGLFTESHLEGKPDEFYALAYGQLNDEYCFRIAQMKTEARMRAVEYVVPVDPSELTECESCQ